MNSSNSRLIGLGLAAGAAALAATALTIVPVNVGAATPPVPQLFQGPAPGEGRLVDVDLYVVPPSRSTAERGDSRPLHQIDADFSQSDGTYAVYVDPATVPPHLRSDDGVVDFMVFSTDANDAVWSVSFSARAVATTPTARTTVTGAAAWLDPGRSSSMIARQRPKIDGYPALTSSASARYARGVGDDDPDDETVEVPQREYAPVPLPRPRAGGDPGTCLRETYVGDKNVSTTIGTSYPIGETRSWMTHDSTTRSESTLGIAVGLEGDGGGVSFTKNRTRFTTGSWGGAWDPAPHMRSYRIQVNYHHTILGKGCNGAVHYWRPHVETGGASTNRSGLSRPDWRRYCVQQPKGYTFHRQSGSGHAYTYGSAVKFRRVIGVDLSISRQYSANQRISYKFTNERPHDLCGSDAYPAQAGKLIDRFH